MPTKRKKILVIRFSSIGDIVLTTPVVRCLKQQLNAEVHFLTKAAFESIAESNPNIDKVFGIKKQLSEVLMTLKTEAYDCIIDLHKNLRSLQVKMALNAKVSSFDKLNYEKWLMTRFKINRLPDVHIVDRYLKAVEFLGVENDKNGLDYFIPKTEELDIQQFEFGQTPFIAFAIGAAHGTKRLPPEKIAEICSGLNCPAVLLGGPADKKRGALIVAMASNTAIFNQCGLLSLHQSASVVAQSHLVITHDTGMMHIAAALKKTIISIWGNTIPGFGMSPYYPEDAGKNHLMQVMGLKCRPCSKIGHEICPKEHFKCMQDQDVGAIIGLANGYLHS